MFIHFIQSFEYLVLIASFSIISSMASPLLADEFALRKDETVLYAGITLSSLSIINLAAYIIIRRTQNRFIPFSFFFLFLSPIKKTSYIWVIVRDVKSISNLEGPNGDVAIGLRERVLFQDFFKLTS